MKVISWLICLTNQLIKDKSISQDVSEVCSFQVCASFLSWRSSNRIQILFYKGLFIKFKGLEFFQIKEINSSYDWSRFFKHPTVRIIS